MKNKDNTTNETKQITQININRQKSHLEKERKFIYIYFLRLHIKERELDNSGTMIKTNLLVTCRGIQ